VRRWYHKSEPIEIEPYPWLGDLAVDFFEHILRPDFVVIEHGSGGSTLWLAERVKKVISIEDNPVWIKAISDLNIPNVEISEHDPKRIKCDLLFIDGDRGGRIRWMNKAHEFVKPGGWVVLDNASQPEYKEARAKIKKRVSSFAVVNCNEAGTAHLVTDFYRMEG